MLSRSESSVTRRTSTPPIRIAPPVTSYSRGTRLAIVDLPAPEWPTSATSWPGSTRKETSCSTSTGPPCSGSETSSSDGSETSVGRGVAERDAVELDRPVVGRDRDGVGCLADHRLEVEHLEDPVEADHRAHDVDPDVGERRERPVQPRQQQRQRDDVAGAERAGEREPATEAVDERGRQRGDQGERGEEGAAVHRRQHADVADAGGPAAEGVGLGGGPPEELDQQRAGDVEPLGHRRVHRRVEPVGLPGDLRAAACRRAARAARTAAP